MLEFLQSQMLGHSTVVEQMQAGHTIALGTNVIESLYGFLASQQGQKFEMIANLLEWKCRNI